MADVLCGTCPCPQPTEQIPGQVTETCKQTAQVFTTDVKDEYKAICPDGHEHSFQASCPAAVVTKV